MNTTNITSNTLYWLDSLEDLPLNMTTTTEEMVRDFAATISSFTQNDFKFVDYEEEPYIFDDVNVRVSLFVLYSIVFFFCFFGNLIVVLVMTLHWRMRSVTKFCLCNLAVANLCVGIFCIYQNLSMYLIDSWVFGDFMCKMYHFFNNVSHTASIFILVVIALERYMVILHPFKCRRMLTKKRLKLIIMSVWMFSIVVCIPRMFFIVTVRNELRGGLNPGDIEVLCVLLSNMYDSSTADIVQFFLLFFLPLIVITCLYVRIGMTLRTSKTAWDSGMVNQSDVDGQSEKFLPTSPATDTTVDEESPTYNCHMIRNFLSRDRRESPAPVETTQLRVEPEVPTKATLAPDQSDESANQMPAKKQHIFRVLQNKCLSLSKPRIPLGWLKSSKFHGESKIRNRIDKLNPKTNLSSSSGLDKIACGGPQRPSSLTNSKGTRLTDFLRLGNAENGTLPPCEQLLGGLPGKAERARTSILSPPQPQTSFDGLPSIQNRFKLVKGRQISFSRMASDRGMGNGRNRFHRQISTTSSYSGCRPHSNAVRMLVIIVITFAICNFPFHLRKLYQHYSHSWEVANDLHELLVPLSFLAMYANCAINPILYAFMSKTFRTSCKEVLTCNIKKQIK